MTKKKNTDYIVLTKLRPMSTSHTTASRSISRNTFSVSQPVFPANNSCAARCIVKGIDASGRGGGGAVLCSYPRKEKYELVP